MNGSDLMGKTIIIPKSIKQIDDLSKSIDGVLLPLENYSVNFKQTFSFEQIDEILSKVTEVFILMNKNFHHDELESLKKTLEQLNSKKISGIFFYDLAIMNVKDKINHPLIWAQEHLTTSFLSINYWYDKGVMGTLVSNEITKEEIKEIKENTKSKLFLIVFGYVPIFTSKRHLVKNYLKTFHLKEKKEYFLEKENKKYPIIDSDHGSFVYTSHILDIREDVKDLHLDYEIYNANEIDEEQFKRVMIKKETIPFTDQGFFYKETIYKVKK